MYTTIPATLLALALALTTSATPLRNRQADCSYDPVYIELTGADPSASYTIAVCPDFTSTYTYSDLSISTVSFDNTDFNCYFQGANEGGAVAAQIALVCTEGQCTVGPPQPIVAVQCAPQ